MPSPDPGLALQDSPPAWEHGCSQILGWTQSVTHIPPLLPLEAGSLLCAVGETVLAGTAAIYTRPSVPSCILDRPLAAAASSKASSQALALLTCL